jgi:hypothetical protein
MDGAAVGGNMEKLFYAAGAVLFGWLFWKSYQQVVEEKQMSGGYAWGLFMWAAAAIVMLLGAFGRLN